MNDINSEIVNDEVLQKILYRILVAEKQNLKNKKLNDAKMAEKIMGIIQEEEQCYSGK